MNNALQFIIKIICISFTLTVLINAAPSDDVARCFLKEEYPQLEEGVRLFHSDIYEEWASQCHRHIDTILKKTPLLSALLDDDKADSGGSDAAVDDDEEEKNGAVTALAKEARATIKKWLEPPPSQWEEKRKQWQEELTMLRSLAAQLPDEADPDNELEQELVLFCRELSNRLYLEFDLMPVLERNLTPQPDSSAIETEEVSIEQLKAVFEKVWTAQSHNPTLTGSSKSLNYRDDPHFYGDLPFFVATIESKEEPLRIVSMANPVAYDGDDTAHGAINSLFIQFCHTCVEDKRPHLYVNVMDRVDDDKISSYKIEQLDSDSRFKSYFHVVTLDMHSGFYRQADKDDHFDSTTAFIDAFYAHLFDDSDSAAYYWSSALDLDEWKATIKTLLEDIHEKYFASSDNLSRKQRLDFIAIANALIVDKLADALKPHSLNISCKHATDHSNQLLLLFLLYHTDAIAPAHLPHLATLSLAMAPLTHNRPADRAALLRTLNAATLL